MSAPKMEFTIIREVNNEEVTNVLNIRIADVARYDIIRNRYGFPAQEDGTTLWALLIAYCNMVRTGLIPINTKPEEFIDTVVSVEFETEDAEEQADAPKSE